MSNPIIVRTSIDPNLINVDTNEKVKVGDVIKLWDLSDSGIHEEVYSSPVQSLNGELVIQSEVSSFSAWTHCNGAHICSAWIPILNNDQLKRTTLTSSFVQDQPFGVGSRVSLL